MDAIKKGYMGSEIPITTNFDGPSRIEEQTASLSNALAYYPEYSDKDASRNYVELLSKILPKFKHLNTSTLAAALVFQKRYGNNYSDQTGAKFGDLMGIFNYNWKLEKNLNKNIAYKADILRYLRMIYTIEELK